MQCTGCGAGLDPHAEFCAYCRAPTPYGAHVRAQREAAERHQAHQRWQFAWFGQQAAHADARKLGSTALIWSLVGLVPCLFLVPNVIAIVFAFKAHAAAKKANASMPGTAIGAIVVSAFWIVLMPLAIVMAEIDEGKRQARIEAIDDELSGELDDATLDADAACLLTEKGLLQGLYGSETSFKKVDCDLATLERTEEGLELRDARATFGTNKQPDALRVCLKKGTRWSVESIKPLSVPCGAPAMPASAATTQATAAPTVAPTGADATAAPASSASPRLKNGRR